MIYCRKERSTDLWTVGNGVAQRFEKNTIGKLLSRMSREKYVKEHLKRGIKKLRYLSPVCFVSLNPSTPKKGG